VLKVEKKCLDAPTQAPLLGLLPMVPPLLRWRIQTPQLGASILSLSPFLPFLPFLPLEVSPLKYSYGFWGSAVSSHPPAGSLDGTPAEIEFSAL